MKKLVLFMALISLISCNKEELKSTNNLDGVWIEGEWTTMSVAGVDTTYTSEQYVGDMYNNGVTTVNTVAPDYTTGMTVMVDGTNYIVISYSGDTADPDWRYYLELEIVTSYNGCKKHLEIYKRQND